MCAGKGGGGWGQKRSRALVQGAERGHQVNVLTVGSGKGGREGLRIFHVAAATLPPLPSHYRFGASGLRIFRLLLLRGQLEQKQVIPGGKGQWGGGDWGGKDGGRLHNTASPAVLRPLDAILIWPAPPPLPA